MKFIRLFIFSGLLIAALSSCTDVIDVNVAPGETQLVIDAFINNRDTIQTIRLTRTVPYFQAGNAPVVSGAEIVLTNQTTGREFVFTDTRQNGIYAWVPAEKDNIGKVGDSFRLSVRYQSDVYEATSRLNRTTRVDSIVTEEREATPGTDGNKEGYYAEFYGTDSSGRKDFYWFRSFKNGVYQTRLLSFGTNGIGGRDNENGADGFRFIPPIRESITDGQAPFQVGDIVRVEIWSITEETLDFFIQAQSQINNGGLFARPPENVRSNFVNKNTSGPKATGWFNTSAVSGLQIRVKSK